MTDTEVKHMIKECGNKCELCGSTRNLEIHHIIPRVTQYPSKIVDSNDNLICVCSKCHGALTPKGLLIRCGQENTKRNNEVIEMAFNMYTDVRDYVLKEWEGYTLIGSEMYDLWNDSFKKIFKSLKHPYYRGKC